MQDKDRIARLSDSRAGGVVSLALSWRTALSMLPESLQDQQLERIAGAAPSPDAVRRLARALRGEPSAGASWSACMLGIENADADLAEWMGALDRLLIYAESRGLRPGLQQASGYLNCCAEVAQAQVVKMSLPEVVDGMLEAYGLVMPPA